MHDAHLSSTPFIVLISEALTSHWSYALSIWAFSLHLASWYPLLRLLMRFCTFAYVKGSLIGPSYPSVLLFACSFSPSIEPIWTDLEKWTLGSGFRVPGYAPYLTVGTTASLFFCSVEPVLPIAQPFLPCFRLPFPSYRPFFELVLKNAWCFPGGGETPSSTFFSFFHFIFSFSAVLLQSVCLSTHNILSFPAHFVV